MRVLPISFLASANPRKVNEPARELKKEKEIQESKKVEGNSSKLNKISPEEWFLLISKPQKFKKENTQ